MADAESFFDVLASNQSTIFLRIMSAPNAHLDGRIRRTWYYVMSAFLVVSVVFPAASALAQNQVNDEVAALSGTITDEQGVPVNDATLQLSPSGGGRIQQCKTDENGKYSFQMISTAGSYQLWILSNRCVGLNDSSTVPVIEIDPDKSVVRDFKLKEACQVRIQVVDEDGYPVPKATIWKPGRHDGRHWETDQQGQVLIGGFAPSKSEYQFGVTSSVFATSRLRVVLDNPKIVVEQKVVMLDGIEVVGIVTCSDGKPAEGWRIVALPSWWDFGASPSGELIAKDGTFTFPHIGPDSYYVNASIDVGNGALLSRRLLTNTKLAEQKGPLRIELDHPSPSSLVSIEGTIDYIGGVPKQVFWIDAVSPITAQRTSQFFQPGETKFKLGQIIAGEYDITFRSRDFETKTLKSIKAPSRDLKIELQIREPLFVRGSVATPEGKPIEEFRLRIIKLNTLRGPPYGVNPDWQIVTDLMGRFSLEVPGPGVYAVDVSAKGFAISRTDSLNTDEHRDKELKIKLKEGRSLSGMIFNEAGEPIDGAMVVPISKCGSPLPVSMSAVNADFGVKSQKGLFRFVDLNAGKETLHVVHPDYAVAKIKDLEIQSEGEQPPLKIVMQRGCMVEGRVYDNEGQPEAGVTLRFLAANTYGSSRDLDKLEFTAVTTDAMGFYRAEHLPQQLIYVFRNDEEKSLGVTRQAVLTDSAKVRTLNFGGEAKSTGRILLNGQPLVNAKVLLSGESAHSGIVRIQTMTDADGRFVFRGVPVGDHILYVSKPSQPYEWVAVAPKRFDGDSAELGTIDAVFGTLVVQWGDDKTSVTDHTQLSLNQHLPDRRLSVFPIAGVRRSAVGNEFVFENLASGKYQLTMRDADKIGFRQAIDFVASEQEQLLKMALPEGLGTVRGSFEDIPKDRLFAIVHAADDRFQIQIPVKEDGTFEFTGLSDGDYYLTQSVRNAERLVEFSIRNGETKTIVVPKGGEVSQMPKGWLVVRVFTPEGVFVQGAEVMLSSEGRPGTMLSTYQGATAFLTPTGEHQFCVTVPGFKPLRKTVNVKPRDRTFFKNESNDNTIDVTLLR